MEVSPKLRVSPTELPELLFSKRDIESPSLVAYSARAPLYKPSCRGPTKATGRAKVNISPTVM